MMTMATSTTTATSPWCQHIKQCTSTPSPSLGESFASKVGTRGNNSQKNHPLTVLREIPTRISPLPPTAAVVERHDDAIDRQPTKPRPSLSPTWTVKTHISGPLPSAHEADKYDECTLETKIEELMRRWPSSTIDGAPCKSTGFTMSPSTSPPPSANSPDHEPYDYGLHLDRIAAKVDQMRQRWPLTSTVTPTTATDITGLDLSPSTSPPPPVNRHDHEPHDYGLHLDQIVAKVEMRQRWPSTSTVMPTAANDPHPTMTTDAVAANPPMLAVVQSLDNFLLKYPRPNDSDAPYQPVPNRSQLPSCHDRLAQQTHVLSTMNAILGELNNKLSRFIDALSGSKYTIEMQPKCLIRNPCNPDIAAPRLPTKTVPTPQHPIPVKPPFPHFHRNLTLNWTKANLRPP